jgi:hypothetical protein
MLIRQSPGRHRDLSPQSALTGHDVLSIIARRFFLRP